MTIASDDRPGYVEIDIPAATWQDIQGWARILRRDPEDLLVEAWRLYYDKRRTEGVPMTTEMTIVRVGQVWKDWDARYRHDDPGRCLRVDRIEGEYAICTQITDSDYSLRAGTTQVGKQRRVKLSRLKPTSTGYKLVQEAR